MAYRVVRRQTVDRVEVLTTAWEYNATVADLKAEGWGEIDWENTPEGVLVTATREVAEGLENRVGPQVELLLTAGAESGRREGDRCRCGARMIHSRLLGYHCQRGCAGGCPYV